jgi:hypothetical protein
VGRRWRPVLCALRGAQCTVCRDVLSHNELSDGMYYRTMYCLSGCVIVQCTVCRDVLSRNVLSVGMYNRAMYCLSVCIIAECTVCRDVLSTTPTRTHNLCASASQDTHSMGPTAPAPPRPARPVLCGPGQGPFAIHEGPNALHECVWSQDRHPTSTSLGTAHTPAYTPHPAARSLKGHHQTGNGCAVQAPTD